MWSGLRREQVMTGAVGRSVLLLVVAGLLIPAAASAQLGLAVRAGTMGVGPEAAFGFGDRLVVRAGLAIQTRDVETSFDGIAVRLDMPRYWYHAGLDYHLGPALRVGAGVVIRPDQVGIRGTFDRPVALGGETLSSTQIGDLAGTITASREAPYVLVGVGRHVSPGVGLSLDVGAAYFGSPATTLVASGGTYPQAALSSLLDTEAEAFDDDMKTYLRLWPILSVSLKIGFGAGGDTE